MFEPCNSKPSNIVEIGENSFSRHFFIHRVWTETYYQNPKTDIENIIFEFSYITKLGNIDHVKTQIHGKALHSMLVSCNLKKRPIFIYDKTPYKTTNVNMNFLNGTVDQNYISTQNQPYTQSQTILGNNMFCSDLSQLSQNSEYSNYQNSHTNYSQGTFPQRDHVHQNTFAHNNTYNVPKGVDGPIYTTDLTYSLRILKFVIFRTVLTYVIN